MSIRLIRIAIWLPGLLVAAAAADAQPLQVTDPTARAIRIQLETSDDFDQVGQSFGPALPATWSASGNIGTIVVPVATHEQMRAGSLQPVPDTFTPIVIEINLTTLEATSQGASGQLASGPIQLAFTQNALSTTATGGFAGPDVGPIFCTSQAQIDNLCQFAPSFCGQTCTLVPGSAYDPVSGRLNLIGSETQSGCDGSLCSGPFTLFTAGGDLRLSEAPSLLPGLGAPGAALLAAALLSAGLVAAGWRVTRSRA